MAATEQAQVRSDAMPDEFDYTMSQFRDLPDVLMTKESIIRTVPFLGVGGSQLWVIQTLRQDKQGEIMFVEHVSKHGTVRLVFPAAVCAAIARQHDALNGKSRRRGAAKAIETKLAAGIRIGNPEALRAGRRRRNTRKAGDR